MAVMTNLFAHFRKRVWNLALSALDDGGVTLPHPSDSDFIVQGLDSTISRT